jgi:signal transduction histidine kinase
VKRLSPEVEVALFRIAQEAVVNSGKHAGASDVRVVLSYPDGVARLSVQDNGRGFDLARVPGPTREGRLGLYGMNERAALLGGTLTIDTKPGKGTRVQVEMPLGEPRSEKSVARTRPRGKRR